MPLFVWSVYAASIIQVIATPVIGITLLLLVAERVFGVGFFNPQLLGTCIVSALLLVLLRSSLYLILPAMGVVSEILRCLVENQFLAIGLSPGPV